MEERGFIPRAPRTPLDVEVDFDGDRIAYSKNISESGILIIVDQKLELQKMVKLSFRLPTGGHVDAIGKVARCHKASAYFYECGVSFWDISDEDRRTLERFLSDRIK